MRMRTVGAIGVTMLVVGCGASDDYANDPRPAAPINIGVSVKDDGVHLSPSRPGAGPARLVVSNLTGRSRDVELTASRGASSACIDADTTSGPINPRGTATLRVDLLEGECVVRVRGGSLPSARLVVGRDRPSAQADLLQP